MKNKIIYLTILFWGTLSLAKAQNVGIGTTTPSEKLEVNGAVKIGTTTAGSKGTIRYTDADSNMEAYTGAGWKSMINDFEIVGQDNSGWPVFFSSMLRNQYVNLPGLTYTIKKSGYYLVLLSAKGTGQIENNNNANPLDNRRDYYGEIRLTANNSPNTRYLNKLFFHMHRDQGASNALDPDWSSCSDDSDKSLIRYFDAGTVIQAYAFVQQFAESAAPAQVNAWDLNAQVKYILLR